QAGEERRWAAHLTGRAHLGERQRSAVGQGGDQGNELLAGGGRASGCPQWLAEDGQVGAEQANRCRFDTGSVDGCLIGAVGRDDLGLFSRIGALCELTQGGVDPEAVVPVAQQEPGAHGWPSSPCSHASRRALTWCSPLIPRASARDASSACAGARQASSCSRYCG